MKAGVRLAGIRIPAGVSYSSQDLPCADAQDPPAGVCREKVDSCIGQWLLFLAGMFRVSFVPWGCALLLPTSSLGLTCVLLIRWRFEVPKL